MPHLSRASYSWKKYPAFLTAKDYQIFPALEVLSQKIRTTTTQELVGVSATLLLTYAESDQGQRKTACKQPRIDANRVSSS